PSTILFNATPTTWLFTLSLHDALPISRGGREVVRGVGGGGPRVPRVRARRGGRQPGASDRAHDLRRRARHLRGALPPVRAGAAADLRPRPRRRSAPATHHHRRAPASAAH